MITKHLPLDPRENTQIQLWSPVMKPLASFTSSRGWMNKENGGTEMFGCQDRSPDGAVKKGKGGGGGGELYIGLQFICFTVTVDLQTELWAERRHLTKQARIALVKLQDRFELHLCLLSIGTLGEKCCYCIFVVALPLLCPGIVCSMPVNMHYSL